MSENFLWTTYGVADAGEDWDLAAIPAYGGATTSPLNADTFRILADSKHPEEAFTVLTYLLGEASDDLLAVYGGMPARTADQDAFFETLASQFPQVVDWQVAKDSVAYADNPNFEAYMPAYNPSLEVLGKYLSRWTTTPGLDMDAEIEALRVELRIGLGPIARLQPMARREARYGLLFISPWLLGFLAFTAIPMVATLGFTFTNLRLDQQDPLAFVGLDNYAYLLRDRQVLDSLVVTFRFALIWLPVAVLVPFSVALLLNSRYVLGRSFFRVAFFLPYVVPFVAGVLIWQAMLGEAGWLNEFLRWVGIPEPPSWLRDQTWIYGSLVLMGIWGIGAGIIINLAGLRGHPHGAVRRGAHRRRGAVGAAAPRDAAAACRRSCSSRSCWAPWR